MEALHSTGLTSPLLSQKSVHHFLKNDAYPIFQVPSGRSWHLRIASHPPNCVSKNFELCITPRLANPHLQVTRDKITRCRYNTTTCMHAVAGKSSTITTSDDEGAVGESKENFTQKRFKLLQDDVGPNLAVLEAQARVCTGPTQTRPMDEAQAYKVLNTILQSAKGELPAEEKVSKAQMGAFFGAMTLRANCFPAPTQWSAGERKAMNELWPSLSQILPHEILFLADPEGTLMGGSSSEFGPKFSGQSAPDTCLVGALREVLYGRHLGYEEVTKLLKDVLPLTRPGNSNGVSDALLAAFMICSRMNGETEKELEAYCMAFDDELDSQPIAKVKSLTHYGEPYDGNTRFFRSTLFVAAVRASYGESCLLHGVDWMPPKGGVTEEQMLKHLGACTTLMPKIAVKLLEDKGVGFAYISQREARPSLYSLVDMRQHIKKRPPIATTEKVQHYIKGTGREAMVASFYHEGYEDPLLMLIRRRGVDAGLVIKGEEGALSLTTKDRSPDAVVKGRPLNFVSGFRRQKASTADPEGVLQETFTFEVRASDYGLLPSFTPRIDRSVEKNVELGMAALRGEKGPVYDRIVFNAAVADHLLGCVGAEDPIVAVERAQEAIDSGRALNSLLNYIDRSNQY